MTPRTLADIDADLRELGCGDGSCIIVRPRGMHTNGGCRCFRGDDPALSFRTKAVRALRLYREREASLRTDERDRIVEWLRSLVPEARRLDMSGGYTLNNAADRLERGAMS